MAALAESAELMAALTLTAERPSLPSRYGTKPSKDVRRQPPKSGFAKVRAHPNLYFLCAARGRRARTPRWLTVGLTVGWHRQVIFPNGDFYEGSFDDHLR